MNLMVLSGLAWAENQGAALRLVQRVAAQEVAATTYIDRAAVRTEAQMHGTSDGPGDEAAPVTQVRFSAWLHAGHVDGGVLDEHEIRKSAANISPDHIVVVDARSHRASLVAAALAHLRHAWFPLDEWHRGFVLVADDADLLQLGETLAGTFYCLPQMLGDVEIKRMTRGIMRQAMLMRWIGPTYVKFQQKVLFRALNRAATWLDNRRLKLEERN